MEEKSLTRIRERIRACNFEEGLLQDFTRTLAQDAISIVKEGKYRDLEIILEQSYDYAELCWYGTREMTKKEASVALKVEAKKIAKKKKQFEKLKKELGL